MRISVRIVRFLGWLIGWTVASLSILAAFVAFLAWRHAETSYEDRVEWVGGERLVEVTSSRDGIRVLVFRKWPWDGPGQVRLWSYYAPEQVEAFAYHSAAERSVYEFRDAVTVTSGRWQTFLEFEQFDGPPAEPEQSNRPVRISYADPIAAEDTLANGWRWSPALPFVLVRVKDRSLLLLVLAAPAMLWILPRLFLTIRDVRRRALKARTLERTEGTTPC